MIRQILALGLLGSAALFGDDAARFSEARENGRRFDEAAASMQKVLQAWLAHADEKTLLLPDRGRIYERGASG